MGNRTPIPEETPRPKPDKDHEPRGEERRIQDSNRPPTPGHPTEGRESELSEPRASLDRARPDHPDADSRVPSPAHESDVDLGVGSTANKGELPDPADLPAGKTQPDVPGGSPGDMRAVDEHRARPKGVNRDPRPEETDNELKDVPDRHRTEDFAKDVHKKTSR